MYRVLQNEETSANNTKVNDSWSISLLFRINYSPLEIKNYFFQS
jgi:hypothetical protein